MNTIRLSICLLLENLHSFQKQLSCSAISDEEMKSLTATIDESFELISELEDSSTIAVATLNDLMNYDKIETKSFSIEKKDVNIWTLLEKTISPLTLQAKEKNIHLKLFSQLRHPMKFPQVDIPLQDLRLVGDSIKLGQVIRNLVSNALKFTPPDGSVNISGPINLFFHSSSQCSFLLGK
jgi:signal transduction histidine kinase